MAIGRLLERTRGRPQCDCDPEVLELALERQESLGGLTSPAGSCVWDVVGLQRSVREWAMRQGWGGRPVRQEQAQGILIAALGVLANHLGYQKAA
jgi:hypothetical protein